MIDLFNDLKKWLLKIDAVKIDNNVFKLHYRATFLVMTCACIFITANCYIGDPIDCMVAGVPGDMMDTYCWIHSTYSALMSFDGPKNLMSFDGPRKS